MAAARKRKLSIDPHTSSVQHDIRSFAKVRKIQHPQDRGKKREQTPPPPSLKQRKRGEELDEPHDAARSRSSETKTTESKRVRTAKAAPAQDTPSKKAAALLDRLDLDSKIIPIPFSLNAAGSEKVSPETDAFLQMHAAFLSALSLYYAHNGASSPVDVKTLLPMITTHWKKRAVSLDDLRAMLSIGHDQAESFVLQDYGSAGIRMSREQTRGRRQKRTAGFVEEGHLQSAFCEALLKRWDHWLTSAAYDENRNFTGFLDQLPRAEIAKHASVEKAAPMFARGQQRLADLKAGQASAVADSAAHSKTANERSPAPSTPPQSRGTSLLDRILAKQALTASLPSGPTKQQLERKAALHRVEDVARVLELLAAGRPRCSFGLQAVVQQLQQSLRNPISKEETQDCLYVMTKEITPGFVNVVRNGNVTCVVITKAGRLGLDEIRGRVKAALAVRPLSAKS